MAELAQPARLERALLDPQVPGEPEADLYAVRELLGHSSNRVTELYLHSSRTRTVSAIEAVGTYSRSNRQTEDD